MVKNSYMFRLQSNNHRNVYIRSIKIRLCTCVGRDSDSLRAGRPGDRIPVGAGFSAPIQTSPGTHPPSYTTAPGLSPGLSARGVALTTHTHQQLGLKSRATNLLPLWVFLACSRVKFISIFTLTYLSFIYSYKWSVDKISALYKGTYD
jgi:hypothetical protein